MPKDFHLSRRAALLAAVSACYPLAGAAAPVARVDFAVGNVVAVSATGQERPLAKGAEVNEGDTVSTRDGRAQLRFTDGALMSLIPQTDFKVTQYAYAGKADGSEKGFFNLLKGGMRTITGVIGRTNRQNYEVGTAVATIGIRGTEYSLRYTNSISGNVADGLIQACNAAGCAQFSTHESFFVASNNTLPVLTFKKTEVDQGTPQQQSQRQQQEQQSTQPGGFVAGNQPSGGLFSGGVFEGIGAFAGDGAEGSTAPVIGKGTATFDSDGGLRSVAGQIIDGAEGSPVGSGGTISRGTMTQAQAGNDGLIAWGRWSNGVPTYCDAGGTCYNNHYLYNFHYVAGAPTSASHMQALHAGNATASYSLVGNTTPTQGSMLGTFNSAALNANFGTGQVRASVAVTMDGVSYAFANVLGTGSFSGGSPTFQSSTSVCSGPCVSVSYAGFFAGAQAARAGFTYVIDPLVTRGGSSVITGAVALKKN